MGMTFIVGEIQTICEFCGETVHVSVPFAAAESHVHIAVKSCAMINRDGDVAHTVVVKAQHLTDGDSLVEA